MFTTAKPSFKSTSATKILVAVVTLVAVSTLAQDSEPAHTPSLATHVSDYWAPIMYVLTGISTIVGGHIPGFAMVAMYAIGEQAFRVGKKSFTQATTIISEAHHTATQLPPSLSTPPVVMDTAPPREFALSTELACAALHTAPVPQQPPQHVPVWSRAIFFSEHARTPSDTLPFAVHTETPRNASRNSMSTRPNIFDFTCIAAVSNAVQAVLQSAQPKSTAHPFTPHTSDTANATFASPFQRALAFLRTGDTSLFYGHVTFCFSLLSTVADVALSAVTATRAPNEDELVQIVSAIMVFMFVAVYTSFVMFAIAISSMNGLITRNPKLPYRKTKWAILLCNSVVTAWFILFASETQIAVRLAVAVVFMLPTVAQETKRRKWTSSKTNKENFAATVKYQKATGVFVFAHCLISVVDNFIAFHLLAPPHMSVISCGVFIFGFALHVFVCTDNTLLEKCASRYRKTIRKLTALISAK